MAASGTTVAISASPRLPPPTNRHHPRRRPASQRPPPSDARRARCVGDERPVGAAQRRTGTDRHADRGADEQLGPVEARLLGLGDGDGDQHTDRGKSPTASRSQSRVGRSRTSRAERRARTSRRRRHASDQPPTPMVAAGSSRSTSIAVEDDKRDEPDDESGDRAEQRPRVVGEVEQLVGADEEPIDMPTADDHLEHRRGDVRGRRSRRGSRSPQTASTTQALVPSCTGRAAALRIGGTSPASVAVIEVPLQRMRPAVRAGAPALPCVAVSV